MIRTVGELIDALRAYDPSIPIAIRAKADNGDGVTSLGRRVDASGIPLAVEVDDVYYSNLETAREKGIDSIICITNQDAQDMRVEEN